MSRRRWIILGVVGVPAVVLAVIAAQGLWWYAGFSERLRLADEHAPVVRKALEADGRFSVVLVESFTGSNGCLLVQVVAPPGTRSELETLVASTSPPVPVKYLVTEAKPATRPAY